LVVLEQSINRSIGNDESKKLENYENSKFNIVKSKLTEQYIDWSLKKCLSGKEYEMNKVIQFINE